MIPHGPTDILNHLTGHKAFDYNQITDEVYIGTNMCCQYGFSTELLSKGIRADISLEQDRTDAPDGVDYFLWLPTEDNQPPTLDDFEVGVAFVNFLVDKKVKTYIHCKNGHGRAPTFFAAYLISRGMGVDEAISLISSKRDEVSPSEAQVAGLKEFKQALERK